MQGDQGVPLQNHLVAILHFTLKQESSDRPPVMVMSTSIVRGNQGVPLVQNNWLLLNKTTSQGENMGSWLSPSQGGHWELTKSLLQWVVSCQGAHWGLPNSLLE